MKGFIIFLLLAVAGIWWWKKKKQGIDPLKSITGGITVKLPDRGSGLIVQQSGLEDNGD